jgi:hypothetical protein
VRGEHLSSLVTGGQVLERAPVARMRHHQRATHASDHALRGVSRACKVTVWAVQTRHRENSKLGHRLWHDLVRGGCPLAMLRGRPGQDVRGGRGDVLVV